jgi:hypothetical protein
MIVMSGGVLSVVGASFWGESVYVALLSPHRQVLCWGVVRGPSSRSDTGKMNKRGLQAAFLANGRHGARSRRLGTRSSAGAALPGFTPAAAEGAKLQTLRFQTMWRAAQFAVARQQVQHRVPWRLMANGDFEAVGHALSSSARFDEGRARPG